MNVWVVASFWDNLFTTNQESLNGSSIVAYVIILYKDSQELVILTRTNLFTSWDIFRFYNILQNCNMYNLTCIPLH